MCIQITMYLVMLTVITLNVNELHDHKKWLELWKHLLQSDVICLQEIHLVPEQLFAFKLHTQAYDWFFSLGMSNSAGVAVGVKHSTGVIINKVGEIPGHLLALDFVNLQQHLICIYAPADVKNRQIFFEAMSTFLTSGTILLRDFNSVIDPSDRLSGNLDGTSHMLDVILLNHNFVEIDGSHRGTFSYFHPSISSRKSQIDRIYVNFHNPCL